MVGQGVNVLRGLIYVRLIGHSAHKFQVLYDGHPALEAAPQVLISPSLCTVLSLYSESIQPFAIPSLGSIRIGCAFVPVGYIALPNETRAVT